MLFIACATGMTINSLYQANVKLHGTQSSRIILSAFHLCAASHDFGITSFTNVHPRQHICVSQPEVIYDGYSRKYLQQY